VAPRPPDLERRKDLLAAVIATVGEEGIGGRSLRDIAETVGTSHRVLLHHFGSREGLLLAIVEEVERRQVGVLQTLPDDPAGSLGAMWKDVRRPELRPFERLFFECYARGAQGEAPFDRMLPGAVDRWLAEVDRLSAGRADAALARLGLAVVRGLLLDLAGTDDVRAVDAAMKSFLGMLRTTYDPSSQQPPSGKEAP
jgi:AcrR family transcriptional regulator